MDWVADRKAPSIMLYFFDECIYFIKQKEEEGQAQEEAHPSYKRLPNGLHYGPKKIGISVYKQKIPAGRKRQECFK